MKGRKGFETSVLASSLSSNACWIYELYTPSHSVHLFFRRQGFGLEGVKMRGVSKKQRHMFSSE